MLLDQVLGNKPNIQPLSFAEDTEIHSPESTSSQSQRNSPTQPSDWPPAPSPPREIHDPPSSRNPFDISSDSEHVNQDLDERDYDIISVQLLSEDVDDSDQAFTQTERRPAIATQSPSVKRASLPPQRTYTSQKPRSVSTRENYASAAGRWGGQDSGMEAIAGLMASQQKIIEIKEREKTRRHEMQMEKDRVVRMEEMQLEREKLELERERMRLEFEFKKSQN
jgi:hypothetical protein